MQDSARRLLSTCSALVRYPHTGESITIGRCSRRFAQVAGSGSEQLVQVPEGRLKELLQAEVQYLATVPIRALSLRDVLDCLNPCDLAALIHSDAPKRFAVRIRMIENLSGWRDVPELVGIHSNMTSWYRMLRLVQRNSESAGGLSEFATCIKNIRALGKSVVSGVVVGMHKLRQAADDGSYSDEFLNAWMDGFLLSRIGTNTLLDQFAACLAKDNGGLGRPTGIIDPECDPTKICGDAARVVSRLCQNETGYAPPIVVETYAADIPRVQVDSPRLFSYIPSYLRYIMVELLKNSLAATVQTARSREEVECCPVHVLVTTDEHQVAIRVSDRAGGMPSAASHRIWSYLYGAAARNDHVATRLAGYGVGLPLSRLHARYLGGELEVRSFPGFGTDAYL
eukprot:CAMPEP_0172831720 /NCGR_PEP_ID=MMETSP1075-20121228/23161_1 /TAXON_ID=2916 /ORGANISM="Ceratium fusus, Strain PA161109" /LENGTH=396 /DNA_ID=CAMNT_0013674223 /DNA_START=47 /DNA_END=1233 /DNA_ORIENTATION=+